MAVLVLLPVLVYGLPSLIGHPVLPGDDMTQNFPLRVLVGREIASGHLPLYDAYAWSGSALLAGWNAGAAYPPTWLFAVLPAVAAWTIGLIVTWATTATGLFAFLRALRLRPAAAFLGALSFALAGAMCAQVTHFGLVAGMSWVPLGLLAVLRLSQPSSRTDHGDSPVPSRLRRVFFRFTGPREQLRWAALLAVAVGLIILAGEPRAVADGCAIIGIYALWQVWRLGLFRFSRGSSRRQALPGSLLIAAGCLLGVALGAVQWLPGLDAVSSSQRGSGTLALFADGSLPSKWLALTLVPDLLGGSGSLGQPSFFGSYNLTELTSYVGILPLVAAFALLGRALASRPWRTRRVPEWVIWHVTGVVGILLALGGNSPLAQVLYRLPLFGTQRLQSRNILLLDLALAILLAYWLDNPFPERSGAGARVFGGAGARVRARLRMPSVETVTALLPPLAILVVVVLSLTWGAGLLDWLGIPAATSAAEIGPLRPWLVPFAVLAAGAAVLVLFGRRLGRKRWPRVCTVFVFADIVAFTVVAVLRVGTVAATAASSALAPSAAAPAPASASASASAGAAGPASAGAALTARVSRAARGPAPARPVAALGYLGRFAIYDPGLGDSGDLTAIGPPNSNDLTATGMPSVQGYSSIVDGTYAAATGSHQASGGGQNVLSPAAIGDGTLDSLDTSVLLTLPDFLTTSVPSLSRAASSAASSPASSAGSSGGAATGPGQRRTGAGQVATWYLGQSATVSRVVVPDAAARADAAAGTEIGLTAPDGRSRWLPARASGPDLEIALPRPGAATTILARDPRGTRALTLGAPSAGLADGHALVANGQLQDALVPPRWDTAGFDGGFAVFTDRLAAAPLTVEPLPGHGASAGRYAETVPASALTASVQPVMTQDATSTSADVTAATVESAHGVRLVRAVAAIPGWSATWQPRNGQPVTLSVTRDGVVQAVDVPAGQGTVTWHYMTPNFPAGLGVSIVAALLILALTVAGRRQGRRLGQ